MERVFTFARNIPNTGLNYRASTPGAELDLVNHFVDFSVSKFLKSKKDSNLAIFLEPKISSGYPDIVFAYYSSSILNDRPSFSKPLSTEDLKVLSFIIRSKRCSGKKIIQSLSFKEGCVLSSLEKLYDRGLVFRNSEAWQPIEISKFFSIKKLISIEAKISDIKRVTQQSILNTWFASHSYALIDTKIPTPSTIANFQRHGIGLYNAPDFDKLLEPTVHMIPSSYLSLQFNEWIFNYYCNSKG